MFHSSIVLLFWNSSSWVSVVTILSLICTHYFLSMYCCLRAEIEMGERTVTEHPLGLHECDKHFSCIITFNFITVSEVDDFAALQTRKLGPREVNWLVFSKIGLSHPQTRSYYTPRLHLGTVFSHLVSTFSGGWRLYWSFEIAPWASCQAWTETENQICSLFYFSESQEIWPNLMYFSKLPSDTYHLFLSLRSLPEEKNWVSEFHVYEEQMHKAFLF